PVEIVDERTATDTTYANPSGTYTVETSTVPIRVETSTGWKPVDLTLVEKDGVLVPRMAAGLIKFSAGGSDPMVEIGHGSATTAVQWPDMLPEPVVDGATATYEDVFDGVDLKLSITDAGVSQVLVVHDAQAAANPELEKLDLATTVEGGSIEPKDGGYLVVDDTGREVGMSPPPVMWDSSGTLLDADRDVIADRTAEAVEQRIQGPTQGDDISDIDLTVTEDALVLAPDEDALVGEDVSYPVYIDPIATSSSPTNWSMVFKQNPNSTFFKWTDSAGQGVGYQNYNGVSTKRLFYEHNIGSVSRTKIKSATFTARMNWSASCAARGIRVYRVAAPVSSRTWNNQPDWLDWQDTKTYSAGWADCNPGGRDVAWNVTSAVTDAAAASRPTVSFGMRAIDEGDPLSWRRFRHTTVLRVEYNRPPSAPTSLKVAGKTCTSTGVLLKRMTSAPVMSAVMKDPDGGNVRGWFQWAKRSSISSSDPEIRSADHVSSGSPVSTKLPGALVDGTFPSGTWSFRVRGSDSYSDYGSYSAQCKFTVDSTLAPVPQIKSYPGESVPDERWLAGAKQSVQFWPADGQAADTAGYAYTLDNDQAPTAKSHTPTNADKSIAVELPAQTAGLHVLRLWAYDAAGNRSQDPDL
ncbi:DNRLRE domain-containing protein, partial [Aeromicrobium sp. CF3.5]|uniref:DNRLRE domain-containing protein n=1 Tax=Aeromicrobium sp. CF3.5 TaxID=3373078 RepID=UPI003EE74132